MAYPVPPDAASPDGPTLSMGGFPALPSTGDATKLVGARLRSAANASKAKTETAVQRLQTAYDLPGQLKAIEDEKAEHDKRIEMLSGAEERLRAAPPAIPTTMQASDSEVLASALAMLAGNDAPQVLNTSLAITADRQGKEAQNARAAFDANRAAEMLRYQRNLGEAGDLRQSIQAMRGQVLQGQRELAGLAFQAEGANIDREFRVEEGIAQEEIVDQRRGEDRKQSTDEIKLRGEIERANNEASQNLSSVLEKGLLEFKFEKDQIGMVNDFVLSSAATLRDPEAAVAGWKAVQAQLGLPDMPGVEQALRAKATANEAAAALEEKQVDEALKMLAVEMQQRKAQTNLTKAQTAAQVAETEGLRPWSPMETGATAGMIRSLLSPDDKKAAFSSLPKPELTGPVESWIPQQLVMERPPLPKAEGEFQGLLLTAQEQIQQESRIAAVSAQLQAHRANRPKPAKNGELVDFRGWDDTRKRLESQLNDAQKRKTDLADAARTALGRVRADAANEPGFEQWKQTMRLYVKQQIDYWASQRGKPGYDDARVGNAQRNWRLAYWSATGEKMP